MRTASIAFANSSSVEDRRRIAGPTCSASRLRFAQPFAFSIACKSAWASRSFCSSATASDASLRRLSIILTTGSGADFKKVSSSVSTDFAISGSAASSELASCNFASRSAIFVIASSSVISAFSTCSSVAVVVFCSIMESSSVSVSSNTLWTSDSSADFITSQPSCKWAGWSTPLVSSIARLTILRVRPANVTPLLYRETPT